MTQRARLVHQALAHLGIDRMLCAVHDRSFPVEPDEDLGCGALGSRAAADFMELLAEIGFTGMQLGPSGRVTPGNLSPYDGTTFSRSELCLAAHALTSEDVHGARLLSVDELAHVVRDVSSAGGDRSDYRHAFPAMSAVLGSVHRRWDSLDPASAARRALDDRLAVFRAPREGWIVGDALHGVLSARHGHPDPARWPDAGSEGALDAALYAEGEHREATSRQLAMLTTRHAVAIERHAREQLLLWEQHVAARDRARHLGLAMYGDLAIGTSFSDRWVRAPSFLEGYALGAPPSRTNPEGQPWGYPVLDPARFGEPGRRGPAWRLVADRADACFEAYDGLRIDHPHGLVCPWVYRLGHSDPYEAVRAGARLRSSPNRPDHRALAALAIARTEQLTAERPPYADDWVRELDDDQVTRYAVLVDCLLESARAHGRRREDVVCEILSTCPHPLRRVLERHGLGRFRVTQKADPHDPNDVYRPEQARPEDWIMVGTHDTASIWQCAHDWHATDIGLARAGWLAGYLAPRPSARDPLERWITARPGHHALAELSVVFTSAARNVMVFVADLLGETARYNEPGVVSERNWTLRVPATFRARHAERIELGAALDLPAVLWLALASARTPDAPAGLLDALRREARAPLPDEPADHA